MTIFKGLDGVVRQSCFSQKLWGKHETVGKSFQSRTRFKDFYGQRNSHNRLSLEDVGADFFKQKTDDFFLSLNLIGVDELHVAGLFVPFPHIFKDIIAFERIVFIAEFKPRSGLKARV